MQPVYMDFGKPTGSPLRSLLRYGLWTAVLLLAAACFVLGPGRLYGIVRSTDVTGEVMKILPYGRTEASVTDLYLVELHAADSPLAPLVYLVPSNDPQWMLINVGEKVCVRLYPTAPWTTASGPWQNALLVAKLPPAPPPELPPLAYQSSMEPELSAPKPIFKDEPPALLPRRERGARIAEPGDTSVGILYNTNGVYWLATTLPADLPQRLEAGRLIVEEGHVGLDFDSGAQFIAEGPSVLEVVSGDHLKHVQGTLIADVPDDLTTFIVSVPGASLRPASVKEGAATADGEQPAEAVTDPKPETPSATGPATDTTAEPATEPVEAPQNTETAIKPAADQPDKSPEGDLPVEVPEDKLPAEPSASDTEAPQDTTLQEAGMPQ